MKNKQMLFWTTLLIILFIISLGWYLTSYKTLESASWSFSLKNNPELNTEINQINQSLKKILGLINNYSDSNNDDDNNNSEVIKKIKHKIIEAEER